jgi:putative oxidoreductase
MKLSSLWKPLRLPAGPSVGLLLVRLVAGLAFVFHGYGKIQNPLGWMGPESAVPGVLQLLAAVSEFVGGIAWLIGLLTPLFSFGLACTMIVAAYLHAVVLGDGFVAQGPGQGSYELASVYLCISLLLLLAGPGQYSLDRLLFGERELPSQRG